MKKQKTGWKLLLVLTMLVMCVGCGAKKNTSGSVSMYDLRTAMEAADPDLPEMPRKKIWPREVNPGWM